MLPPHALEGEGSGRTALRTMSFISAADCFPECPRYRPGRSRRESPDCRALDQESAKYEGKPSEIDLVVVRIGVDHLGSSRGEGTASFSHPRHSGFHAKVWSCRGRAPLPTLHHPPPASSP